MADYGHELAFGTFITPQNARPNDVVALAQLTESVGLDLATFQDHPYQPAFLDTWTLLSWVAAQTETLRVAPNVLNLPLRNPAVTARSAASLDLLSSGRFDLGLGAGTFWDAIEAMGGPRRTPGESVDALSEALDVIRGVWDADAAGGVRVDGEHYRVHGAKRGPLPAHDIEIWLGAYKPRMLRLTGAKADGWLPSLAYMSLDDLGPANRRIDEAAVAAGRDPREIRRLLNIGGAFAANSGGFLQGPVEQWVENLVELALEHGFSTFILASDDPGDFERFGREVAPAVREAVGRERGAAGSGSGSDGSSARAPVPLHPAIDYERLPGSLAAKSVGPGDHAYSQVRSTYIRRGSPGLVIQPESVDDVVDALAFARGQEVPLSVRSGGHGISGRSTNDGGIVIDLRKLDATEVLDSASGRVRLGTGARWGDVANSLAPYGLGVSSGDYGDVGVGGLATAGGVGFMVRKHGLTIDHVTAAEIVLADGSVVRADRDRHPDLLWAIRGAGGNFGIVTAVELDAYPVGDIVFSTSVIAADDTAELLEKWGRASRDAPRELTSFLLLAGGGGRRSFAQSYSVYAGDDRDAAAEALAPLLGLGGTVDQRTRLLPYPAVVAPHGGTQVGGGPGAFRAGLLDSVTPEAAGALAGMLDSGSARLMMFRPVDGAVHDVAPDATSFAHRSQGFSVNVVGTTQDALNALWDTEIAPHTNGLYLSFDGDTRPERLHDAFPGETLTKLRRLKARYDPDNVFDRNFAIPPAEGESESDALAA